MNGRLKNWLRGGSLYFLLDAMLVVALALAAAYWTWVFAAPPRVAAPGAFAPGETKLQRSEAARQLFGAPHAAAAPAAAFAGTLRLVGVAAAGARGRAIFAVENGKFRTAGAGEEVLAGVVLREIHADHAVVERDGRRERVELLRRAASVDVAPRARRDAAR